MSNRYDDLIWRAGQTHAIDPALIKAIVWAESNFNPRAYRAEPHVQDGSYGLMQTLLGTARWMGYGGPPEGLYDPATSIEFGTRYLKKQILRYGGNTPSAVAAYNAGTAKVVNGRYINQDYVNKVMGRYEQYKRQEAAEQERTATVRSNPNMGTEPSGPPVRIQAYNNGEEIAATFETFLSSDYGPAIVAAGVALLASTLFSRRD